MTPKAYLVRVPAKKETKERKGCVRRGYRDGD